MKKIADTSAMLEQLAADELKQQQEKEHQGSAPKPTDPTPSTSTTPAQQSQSRSFGPQAHKKDTSFAKPKKRKQGE
jgi:hypothetical protein